MKIKNRFIMECMLNSASLLKAADLLFRRRFYALSTSMSVLAIEEASKAASIRLFYNDVPLGDIPKSQMSDHKKKIDYAAFFSFFGGLMREGLFNKSNLVSIEEYQERSLEYLKARDKRYLRLLEIPLTFSYLNLMKMRGFYVDLARRKVLTPRHVRKREASRMIRLAHFVVNEIEAQVLSG